MIPPVLSHLIIMSRFYLIPWNLSIYFTFNNIFNTIFLNTPTRLPWGQDTVNGWVKTMIYTTVFAGAFFSMNAISFASFFTICVQFDALGTNFRSIQSQLDEKVLNKPGSDSRIKSILCECIQFHIQVRKYVFQSL